MGAPAGRKALSRALRSRFLQILVPDLPSSELATVLERRCRIPASHAGKLVSVMGELRMRRSRGHIFAGCHGLITPRDLFRWAMRQGTTYDDLALHGYSLLAERLRTPDERLQVQQVQLAHCCVLHHCMLHPSCRFSLGPFGPLGSTQGAALDCVQTPGEYCLLWL
jgi:midasin (ATPase involved in ribosome maturation)